MEDKIQFVQLTKVDAKLGQVWGIMSSETPDEAGEIMDYEHSKPNFLKWSDKIQKASGGKSKGNVRTMHNGHMDAVGKIIHMEARDGTKDFYIGAQIVDKQALEKVYAGVYTGFSIGGSYGAWKQLDGAHKRYEAMPVEVSLVDSPCNPDATFQLVKDDGVEELRKFSTIKAGEPMADIQTETPETIEDVLAKAAASDNADVKALGEKLSKLFEKKPAADAPAKDESTQPAADPKAEDKPADEAAAQEQDGAAQEPDPADDGKAADPVAARDEMRAVILSILEELGLVVKEGDAMKAVQSQDLNKATVALDLVKADFAKQGEELAKANQAMKDEIGALSARVEKVTGMGPVIMIPGGGDAAKDQEAEAEIATLKKYMDSAKDPAARDALSKLITVAEIRTIHTQPKQ